MTNASHAVSVRMKQEHRDKAAIGTGYIN